MEELLKKIGIKSLFEIEDIIRSVHLPRGSTEYIRDVIPLPQICQLLYLMITRDVSIEPYNNNNNNKNKKDNNKNTHVLIKHNFHQEDNFNGMSEYSPELHDLLNKSRETGFLILIANKHNVSEYISEMKKYHA
jgi:hypothetical protein